MIAPGLLVVTFLCGVIVGVLLRDAFQIVRTGKGFIMPTARRLARSRTFLLVLVTAALLVNGLLGFLLIATRAAQEAQTSRYEALVSCVARYNRAQGDALTDRDHAVAEAGDQELDLWDEYARLYQLAKAADTAGDTARLSRLQDAFYHRVLRYVGQLKHLQATRSNNPYPDPDTCAGKEIPR